MKIIKPLLRWLLGKLYRVRINGFQHYAEAGDRVMIIANHVSFLDAVLLAAFLPGKPTFAVETHIAEAWWVRPALSLVDFFSMNPMNPLSTRALIKYLSENRKAVVFPEGRLTVTGALMKIYQGPGLVADKSQAQVLPIHIDGAQYTPFSRLRGLVRIRWFPRVTLTLLPPRRIDLPPRLRGRARRIEAANVLADIMTEMMFVTNDHHQTLFRALLKARRVYGGRRVIAEDIERNRVTYNQLISRAFILGNLFARNSEPREVVGLLLPNMVSTLIAFMALQLHGRVPAMLNFTAGAQGIATACETADIRVICSSRRFVEAAKLEASIAALSKQVRVIYLEDLRAEVKTFDKLMGLLNGHFADSLYRRFNPHTQTEDPAVVLFTSGSEGIPKAVVLSHLNLLANKIRSPRALTSAPATPFSPVYRCFIPLASTQARCYLCFALSKSSSIRLPYTTAIFPRPPMGSTPPFYSAPTHFLQATPGLLILSISTASATFLPARKNYRKKHAVFGRISSACDYLKDMEPPKPARYWQRIRRPNFDQAAWDGYY